MDRLKGLLWGLLACGLLTLLFGCKSVEYVPVPSVSTDSMYALRWQRDSVYVRDSVFVNQWTLGDTVYVDKVVTKYAYKDRCRYDTVAVMRADTVRVPYPVERKLTKWEKFKQGFSWLFIGVIGVVAIIAVTWLVRWLVEKMKKK